MKKMAVYILFVAIASVFAEGSSCRITAVRWEGDREAYDESLMQGAVGDPCESWTLLRDRLVRRYEDRGFPGAKLHGALDASGVLTLRLERGSAWVWAPPENLDSSGTKPEVFRRLHLFIRPGGLLIFDIREPEWLRSLDGQIFLDENDELLCLWRAVYDPGEDAVTYGMDLFEREGELWRRSGEEHIEYAHEPDKLLKLLADAGFVRGALRRDCPQGDAGRLFITAVRGE